jgi:hypothetical protein
MAKRIGFTVAMRKARERAAQHIELMELDVFWGEKTLEEIDESCHHVLEEAQARLASHLKLGIPPA